MQTITTLHDPQGLLLNLVNEVEHHLRKEFSGMMVVHTDQTEPQLIDKLQELKIKTFIGGLWGESRRQGLTEAVKTGSDWFFICDFDKIIHWLKTEPEEISHLLQHPPQTNSLILGRSPQVFATYPRSWYVTETEVSRLVSKIIGLKADAITATRIFDRQAAEVIIKNGKEDSWGACVEDILLVHQAGLNIGYQEAKGLTFEDPDRCRLEIEEAGGLEIWLEKKFDCPAEWAKRFNASLEQAKVIERFTN